MARLLVHDLAAEEDLIGIWIYSFKNWGEAQADRYLKAMEAAIKKVVEQPDRGKERDWLRQGYWSVRVEHHLVFYTFTEQEVRLRRVLHTSMDVERHI